MTQSDYRAFEHATGQLAAVLRVDPPKGEALAGLYAALEDIPLPLVEAAAKRLAQTAEFYPRPVEWRRTVDAIQVERARAGKLKPDLRGVPETYCEQCDDTGWEPRSCPGAGHLVTEDREPPPSWLGREWWACGRNDPHGPHTYVVECKCRDQNPRYQEKHAPAVKPYAGGGEKRERRQSSGWSKFEVPKEGPWQPERKPRASTADSPPTIAEGLSSCRSSTRGCASSTPRSSTR